VKVFSFLFDASRGPYQRWSSRREIARMFEFLHAQTMIWRTKRLDREIALN
jgi:hypothetical protein